MEDMLKWHLNKNEPIYIIPLENHNLKIKLREQNLNLKFHMI